MEGGKKETFKGNCEIRSFVEKRKCEKDFERVYERRKETNYV